MRRTSIIYIISIDPWVSQCLFREGGAVTLYSLIKYHIVINIRLFIHRTHTCIWICAYVDTYVYTPVHTHAHISYSGDGYIVLPPSLTLKCTFEKNKVLPSHNKNISVFIYIIYICVCSVFIMCIEFHHMSDI